jgi:hypothetical protein
MSARRIAMPNMVNPHADAFSLEGVAGLVALAYLVQELRSHRLPNLVALLVALAVNVLMFTRVGDGRAPARFLGAALIGDLAAAWIVGAIGGPHKKSRLDRVAVAHHVIVPLLIHMTVARIDANSDGFAALIRYRVVWAVLLSETSSVPLHARGFFRRGSYWNLTCDLLFRALFVLTRLVIMPVMAWRGAQLEPSLTLPLLALVLLQVVWGGIAVRAACKKRPAQGSRVNLDRRVNPDPLHED